MELLFFIFLLFMRDLSSAQGGVIPYDKDEGSGINDDEGSGTNKNSSTVLFQIPPGAVHNAVTVDGSYTPIQLEQSFLYFGNLYSKFYLSMDGFLSFEPLFTDGIASELNKDIIAVLWTDIDTYTRGDISYYQATSGHPLQTATAEIKRIFPGTHFSAGWVFIATWENVEFEPDVGEVTFQVVLISDKDSDTSYILMNYGEMPDDPEPWLAGYQTEDNSGNYTIRATSTADLSKTTNVGVPGRWAFRVDSPASAICDSLKCTKKEVCTERSGHFGCDCAKNTTEYSDTFDAQEVCKGSSGSLSLSRCQLFQAGFPAEFLHLNDPDCKGKIRNGRVEFHFDNNKNLCGTTLTHNNTHFIYENAVQTFFGVQPKTVISRDRWLTMNFSCVYPLIQNISMPMSIQATTSVVSKSLSTEGSYQIHMLTYPNASFIEPYSGDVVLKVNQKTFVALEVYGVDPQQISLVLDSCWATPDNNSANPIRWDLIIDECPNPKDGTVQVLQNGVSTSGRFSFNMFTFTHQSDSIHLHCKIHLCLLQGGHCALPCTDGDGDDDGPKRRKRSLDFHDTAAISMSF
ncbi:uromodulin-like [Hoplias malabaricus]|uniref:uromodulin-like n=1 Tax=Hoplias malabaricus TaxID=27720 RepID=UPI003462A40C